MPATKVMLKQSASALRIDRFMFTLLANFSESPRHLRRRRAVSIETARRRRGCRGDSLKLARRVNMKRSILRALALCLSMTFVAGIAWAQDDNTSKSRSSRSGSTSQTSPGSSSGIYGSAPSSSSFTTQVGQPVRLSRLMNTSLKSQSGESLGQVQDLVIDPTSGQIQFAVISTSSAGTGAPGSSTSTSSGTGTSRGTSIGIGGTGTSSTAAGGQLVAIPWRLVTSSGQGQFTATIDRNTLQSAPTFNSSSWPTMDSAWMQSVYSHFGVSPSSTGARDG